MVWVSSASGPVAQGKTGQLFEQHTSMKYNNNKNYTFSQLFTIDFVKERKTRQESVDKLNEEISQLQSLEIKRDETMREMGLVLKTRDTEHGECVKLGDFVCSHRDGSWEEVAAGSPYIGEYIEDGSWSDGSYYHDPIKAKYLGRA